MSANTSTKKAKTQTKTVVNDIESDDNAFDHDSDNVSDNTSDEEDVIGDVDVDDAHLEKLLEVRDPNHAVETGRSTQFFNQNQYRNRQQAQNHGDQIKMTQGQGASNTKQSQKKLLIAFVSLFMLCLVGCVILGVCLCVCHCNGKNKPGKQQQNSLEDAEDNNKKSPHQNSITIKTSEVNENQQLKDGFENPLIVFFGNEKKYQKLYKRLSPQLLLSKEEHQEDLNQRRIEKDLAKVNTLYSKLAKAEHDEQDQQQKKALKLYHFTEDIQAETGSYTKILVHLHWPFKEKSCSVSIIRSALEISEKDIDNIANGNKIQDIKTNNANNHFVVRTVSCYERTVFLGAQMEKLKPDDDDSQQNSEDDDDILDSDDLESIQYKALKAERNLLNLASSITYSFMRWSYWRTKEQKQECIDKFAFGESIRGYRFSSGSGFGYFTLLEARQIDVDTAAAIDEIVKSLDENKNMNKDSSSNLKKNHIPSLQLALVKSKRFYFLKKVVDFFLGRIAKQFIQKKGDDLDHDYYGKFFVQLDVPKDLNEKSGTAIAIANPANVITDICGVQVGYSDIQSCGERLQTLRKLQLHLQSFPGYKGMGSKAFNAQQAIYEKNKCHNEDERPVVDKVSKEIDAKLRDIGKQEIAIIYVAGFLYYKSKLFDFEQSQPQANQDNMNSRKQGTFPNSIKKLNQLQDILDAEIHSIMLKKYDGDTEMIKGEWGYKKLELFQENQKNEESESEKEEDEQSDKAKIKGVEVDEKTGVKWLQIKWTGLAKPNGRVQE